MRSRFRRMGMAAALVGSGGMLFQGSNVQCASLAAENLLTTVDFCFIFDCQTGIFGGTIDPCDIGETNSPNMQPGLVFEDCPFLESFEPDPNDP